jgi:hypothetical protein
MTYKIVSIFIFLSILIVPSTILAKSIKYLICSDIKDPDYYKNLIINSDYPKSFQGWQLQAIGPPLCIVDKGYAGVIIKYNISPSYSKNNLSYNTEVTIHFPDNQLNKSNELDELLEDFKLKVEDFENNEKVNFFIQVTKAKEVEYDPEHDSFRINTVLDGLSDILQYDFSKKFISYFSFHNPKLNDKLEFFAPQAADISLEIQEFKKNNGIEAAEYVVSDHVPSRNTITIWSTNKFWLRGSLLRYHFKRKMIENYYLDNNFEWKTIPEVSKAHEIIKEKLLVGELSNCTIGTGDEHATTIGTYTPELHSWFLIVALKCNDREKRKDASIRLYPNGTYAQLEIKDTYQKAIDDNTNNYEESRQAEHDSNQKAWRVVVITLVALMSILFIWRYKKNKNIMN